METALKAIELKQWSRSTQFKRAAYSIQASMMVFKGTIVASSFVSFLLQLYTITCHNTVLLLSFCTAHISACLLLSPLCLGALIGWCERGKIIPFSWSTGFRQRRTELNKPPLIEFALWSDSRTTKQPGGQKSRQSQTKLRRSRGHNRCLAY